ncbi:MAG: Lin0512 family protein [Candidatus Lindowbacteria bacterium]|nr:Lin0512 family protein [Candidatus Lindowbacteria bacterium]
MSEKRYLIQMGMGVDLHGQNPTKAASRAVHNAIANNCLCGISDVLHAKHAEEKMHVHVLVACPKPEQVDKEAVLKELPFGVKSIEVTEGGMVTPHAYSPELGDKTGETYVANAAVTVAVNSKL